MHGRGEEETHGRPSRMAQIQKEVLILGVTGWDPIIASEILRQTCRGSYEGDLERDAGEDVISAFSGGLMHSDLFDSWWDV